MIPTISISIGLDSMYELTPSSLDPVHRLLIKSYIRTIARVYRLHIYILVPIHIPISIPILRFGARVRIGADE